MRKWEIEVVSTEFGLLSCIAPFLPPAGEMKRQAAEASRFSSLASDRLPFLARNLYTYVMKGLSTVQPVAAKTFGPSRYMRERRPHLFSDSTTAQETLVTREVLSYHLETLTNQKDESRFEKFAHRMAEKFIAPNLRPQTGPTGGGDGKTDAETYPVTSEIALRWFASPTAKPGERIAFAFSAKKDWRSKVKSDVKSIADTKRDYDHIFFVTNQFVPARASASVQDDLKKQHELPITILDRNWLLDRVFGHDSLDIAVDELGVGQGTEREISKLGPKDTARAEELQALEKKIQDGSQYRDRPHALAEDALRAALLARGLEKSDFEVTGRFERAISIAKDRKLLKHELAATYNWAWTSFFWLEDHAKTSHLYDDLERLALASQDFEDLERLNNILLLLRSHARAGTLSPQDAKLDERTARLTASLESRSKETGRPNNALHAKAILLLSRLSERVAKDQKDPLVDIWKEFLCVVREADGLGTFPFESIADTLTELGEHVPESPEFDELYERITDALAARRGEGEAATKNVERAYQKLEKQLPYEAIRWFGRALHLLVKEEYRRRSGHRSRRF